LIRGAGGATTRDVVPGTGRMGMTDTVAGSAAKLRNSRPGGHGESWYTGRSCSSAHLYTCAHAGEINAQNMAARIAK
jgi:hypothetical protein